MITAIWRVSPRERLGKKYGPRDTWPPNELTRMRLDKELNAATYYPRIKELNAYNFILDKDCTLTGRIKYSRGTDKHGIINKKLDIFIEIKWQVSRMIQGKWFETNKMEYKDKTAWITADAFEFDFSDEVTEEIYECA